MTIRPCPPCHAWPSMRWDELSTHDFAQAAQTALLAHTIAVLPLGATEQHGPHLPLQVDSAITNAMVSATIALLEKDAPDDRPPVLFLPTQTIGYSPEHQSFAGTLTLEPQTVISVWLDIGASIARSGVRKLLIFNSHGGHVGMMDIVARQLRVRHGMLTFSTSWNQLPRSAAAEQAFTPHERRYGIHAGDEETSLMLHIAPELVHMERAQNFHSASQDRSANYPLLGDGKSAKMGWKMEDYNPSGAAGNAQAAKAEKGRILVQSTAPQLAALLKELHAMPITMTGSKPTL